MPDPTYSILLLVVDRSGSMEAIAEPVNAGIKQLLADQAELPGLLTLDAVVFDYEAELLYEDADLSEAEVIVRPRGGTALYDALGMSLARLEMKIEALPEHARPSSVHVAVFTDGMDTSSQEHDPHTVRVIVDRLRAAGWTFTFAGQDEAAVQAETIGVDRDSTIRFTRDRASVARTSAMMSCRAAESRRAAGRTATSA